MNGFTKRDNAEWFAYYMVSYETFRSMAMCQRKFKRFFEKRGNIDAVNIATREIRDDSYRAAEQYNKALQYKAKLSTWQR